MGYAPQREMQQKQMHQKSRLHDPFFGLKGSMARPTSIATEIMDTEWEEEEDDMEEMEMMSDIEEANSPRDSLNSVSRSSYRSSE
jgi:hypothetical protein